MQKLFRLNMKSSKRSDTPGFSTRWYAESPHTKPFLNDEGNLKHKYCAVCSTQKLPQGPQVASAPDTKIKAHTPSWYLDVEPQVRRWESCKQSAASQEQASLFRVLPAELRALIWMQCLGGREVTMSVCTGGLDVSELFGPDFMPVVLRTCQRM